MSRQSKKKRYTNADDFLFVLKSQKDEQLTNFLKAELETSNVAELSHEKSEELWVIVHRIFDYHREKIFSNDTNAEPLAESNTNEELEQQSEDKPMTDDVENQTEESVAFVFTVVKKMQAVLATTDPHVPANMMDIMIGLQSFLICSNIDIGPQIRNKIVGLIELWWLARLEIRASMILLAFMFLLKKTSATAKTVLKSDVTRVWKFRESLLKLQLESNGCIELVQKLSALPENKHYLKSKDGCNFIAFLYNLNTEILENLHSTVKRVLPESNRKNADAYGQIYVTAWIKASPEIRSVLEETCIQNFMLHALTLQRQVKDMSRLGQLVLIILNHFHRNRVHPLMRKMLATLYEPLLWRFLWSSNNLHRCNATQVFFSAYPLKCPSAGAEARTLFEDKQHQAISTMLTDSCHIVRIIATKEVFKVMELYWQVLPPECIQGWMKTIVSELVGDSSCADVRRQVFVGFHHLLNNALAVDYVKDIIPKLQMQIHDVNEKVRFAFVKLLLKLKTLNLHYWSFVPLRHIMARLEVENQLIGEQLVGLTIDGFYGSQKPLDQKIRRLMGLFILNQGAGRNFFYYSKPSLGTEDAVDLIVIVLKTLKGFVKMCVEQDKTMDSSTCSISDSSRQESKKGKGVQDKENVDTVNLSTGGTKKATSVNNSVSLDNPVVLQGFLDLVGILWTIHIKDFSKDQLSQLESLCVDCMPSFTSFFQGTDFYSSVLFLASLAPSKALSERYHITSMFLSQLKHLTPDDTDEVYSSLIQPLCSWNQGSTMLDIVQESLREVWTSQASFQTPSSKRRIVTFRVVLETKPEAALKILDAMFSYQPNQMKIVSKNYNQLLELWTDMAKIKDLVVKRVSHGTPLENHLLSDVFLQACLLRYAKLVLILKKDNVDFDCLQEFMNLLEWARETLISQVPAELPPKGTIGVPLVVSLLRDLNYVATNMVMLGIDEPRFCMRIAAFSKDLIMSGCGLMFVHSVTRMIGQLLELCKLGDETQDPMKLLRVVTPSLMTAVLAVMCQDNYPADFITFHVENVSQVKIVMIDLLEMYHKFYGISSPLLQCVIGKFGDSVMSVYNHSLQQTDDTQPAKSIQSLPYMAYLLVSIFASHSSLANLFIENLDQRLITYTEDQTEFVTLTSLLELLRAKSTLTKKKNPEETITFP